MRKTDIDHPAVPGRVFMALGILRGYLKHPLWFLVSTFSKLPAFRKTIPREFPEEFVKANVLQALMYIRMKEHMDQQTAYEIVRAVVLPVGFSIQQANFRTVEAGRAFENLIMYQQRTAREGITRWNSLQVIEHTERRFILQVSDCMYHRFYTSLGIPEMTRMMCAVDNAIFNSYLPERIWFHREGVGHRIVDGAEVCQFVIEHQPDEEH